MNPYDPKTNVFLLFLLKVTYIAKVRGAALIQIIITRSDGNGTPRTKI